MAWSGSSMFRAFIKDCFDNTAAFDMGADTLTVALYNNTGTPDNDATSASSAYNATSSPWVAANEVTSSGEWDAGGVNLSGVSLDASVADTVFLDATDTASAAGATISGAFGCLVYDNALTTPVADQGVCYNYFGGSNSVSNGTFTIVWHANGIWRITATQA